MSQPAFSELRNMGNTRRAAVSIGLWAAHAQVIGMFKAGNRWGQAEVPLGASEMNWHAKKKALLRIGLLLSRVGGVRSRTPLVY